MIVFSYTFASLVVLLTYSGYNKFLNREPINLKLF